MLFRSAYSTKDGSTAEDGDGLKNSPFTSALLEHIDEPEDISVILRKVRSRVMKTTAGRQQPWEYGSLNEGAVILAKLQSTDRTPESPVKLASNTAVSSIASVASGRARPVPPVEPPLIGHHLQFSDLSTKAVLAQMTFQSDLACMAQRASYLRALSANLKKLDPAIDADQFAQRTISCSKTDLRAQLSHVTKLSKRIDNSVFELHADSAASCRSHAELSDATEWAWAEDCKRKRP